MATRHTFVPITLIAVVALGLALAACTDDADAGMSTQEYRDAGNEICRSVDAEVSAILGGGPPTAEAVQTDLAPRLADALGSLENGLDDLEAPTDLADTHAQLLAAVDEATAVLDSAADDPAVAARLSEEGPPMDDLDALAGSLGLDACTADG